MTKIEQLERMVAALRRNVHTVASYASLDYEGDAADALEEADRIASEPVTETDRETVERWSDGGQVHVYGRDGAYRHEVTLLLEDGHMRSFGPHPTADAAYAAAAKWIREREEQR